MKTIKGLALKEYFIEIAKIQLEIGRRPDANNAGKHMVLESLSKTLVDSLYEHEDACEHCKLNLIECICGRVDKFFDKGVSL